MSNKQNPDFVARIDVVAISDNRSVVKLSGTNGNYVTQNKASDDIVEAESFILGGESEGIAGYNLYDADSAYKLSQESPEKLQAAIDYENCYFEAGSEAGNCVIFDKDGYISVLGESSDYNIAMTFNDNYPTDWFTLEVEGKNTSEASLESVEDGYILSADNLESVEISANNKEDSAAIRFSTEFPSVFIYEIDKDSIGLKVDTDNNGTYETPLLDGVHMHTYSNEWKADKDGHWKECECTLKLKNEGHGYEWIIDKMSTVTETGLKHEECRVCGYRKNENTVIERETMSSEPGREELIKPNNPNVGEQSIISNSGTNVSGNSSLPSSIPLSNANASYVVGSKIESGGNEYQVISVENADIQVVCVKTNNSNASEY